MDIGHGILVNKNFLNSLFVFKTAGYFEAKKITPAVIQCLIYWFSIFDYRTWSGIQIEIIIQATKYKHFVLSRFWQKSQKSRHRKCLYSDCDNTNNNNKVVCSRKLLKQFNIKLKFYQYTQVWRLLTAPPS